MLNSNQILKVSDVKFGTSGARGLVTDFTEDVCASFTHAFVSRMRQIFDFSSVAIGIDNRPSSPEMAKYCAAALEQMGLNVTYCGVLPTPALAYYSMQQNIPCIMVTGSHIPFDRNGLKFYRPDGEISKADESGILAANIDFELSELGSEPTTERNAVISYLNRYQASYSKVSLAGLKIGIYEHSSAGRDLYRELFESLGAEVVSIGRSDEFVPIDTEAVSEQDKQNAKDWVKQYNLDALFSTDGDGDRPLLADEEGEYLRGDILGLLCAQCLGVEALAVPVSCNTAIEKSGSFNKVERTKIGSPYVIEQFETLRSRFSSVAGFEANGGFLLGSDVSHNEAEIKALPTRDAILPALVVLAFAKANNTKIVDLVASLPKRFTDSDRVKDFATEKSRAIIASSLNDLTEFTQVMELGGKVAEVNTVDGLRLTMESGDVVHLRPSGNAPELRCYAESKTVERANELVVKTLRKITDYPI